MVRQDEWPTIVLLGAVYSCFALLTYLSPFLPLALTILCLAGVIALHSSLQHEVLHGHPFRTQWVCDATVFPALGLFVPYLRFKDTHLAHHFDPNLTDPYDDPESNFLTVENWDRMTRLSRWIAGFNNTLFGRMLIGPATSMTSFYRNDLHQILRCNKRIVLSYLLHGFGAAVVLAWIIGVTQMPVWAYLVASYVAMSILKIRTFLEHRAHDRAASRSVIIDDRGFLAFLFLNNNFHSVHHAHPNVTWHKLPQVFKARREQFLTRNDGYYYQSYKDVFAKHMLRAKDPVAHPLWTKSNRTQPPKGHI